MAVLLGSQNNVGTNDFFAAGATSTSPFVASASGTLDSISMIVRANPSVTLMRLGIYTDSAGVPDVLLGVATVAGDITSAGTKTVIGLGVTIVSGTTYHLGAHTAGAQNNWTGPAGAYREKGAVNFPSPYGGTSGSSLGSLIPPIWGEDAAAAAPVYMPQPLLMKLGGVFGRLIPPIRPLPVLVPDQVLSAQVDAALQTHTRAQFDLKTNPTLPVAFQSHTRAQFLIAAEEKFTVAASRIDHTRAQYAVTMKLTVAAARVNHTRAQYTLTIKPTLPVARIDHTRAQYNVSITAGTTLPLALQTHTRAQYALITKPTLPVARVDHIRAQHAVTVTGASTLPASQIIHTRAQYTLIIKPTLPLARINHTRQQFNLFIPGGATPRFSLPFHPTEPTEANQP